MRHDTRIQELISQFNWAKSAQSGAMDVEQAGGEKPLSTRDRVLGGRAGAGAAGAAGSSRPSGPTSVMDAENPDQAFQVCMRVCMCMWPPSAPPSVDIPPSGVCFYFFFGVCFVSARLPRVSRGEVFRPLHR